MSKRSFVLLALGTLMLTGALPTEESGEICRDPLEGNWDFLSSATPGCTWSFKDNLLKCSRDGSVYNTCRYKAGPGQPWPTIRFSDQTHGIYSATGDFLWLSVVEKHRPLPTDFTSRNGGQIYILKRR